MELTILGTASAIPTKERNVSAIFLKFKGKGILFDCGEGTQRQMALTGIKRSDVEILCISHWHGDHIGGILPLIQTLGNIENQKPLKIFGPLGTKEYMKNLLNSCWFESAVEIEINEIDPKTVSTICETDDYFIQAANMEHGMPCVGYSFIEKERLNINKKELEKENIPDGPHLKALKKGKDSEYKNKKLNCSKFTYKVEQKKITYITDTENCVNCNKLAESSDILICESTFANEQIDRARDSNHMIAKESAAIASTSNVKQLILTHFSQRYATTEQIEEDARTIFDNTICAYDLMKLNI